MWRKDIVLFDAIPLPAVLSTGKRAKGSDLVISIIDRITWGVDYRQLIRPCVEEGIYCTDTYAVYEPLNASCEKLLNSLERVFFTSHTLDLYRRAYESIARKECFLKVLASILRRLASTKVSNKREKELAKDLLKASFKNLLKEVGRRGCEYSHTAYVAYAGGGPVLEYVLGCYGCKSVTLLREVRRTLLATLPPTFTDLGKEVPDVLLSGLVPPCKVATASIHAMPFYPASSWRAYLALCYRVAGALTDYDIASEVFLSYLYALCDKEEAGEMARAFYRKIAKHLGWVAVARYRTKLIPLVVAHISDVHNPCDPVSRELMECAGAGMILEFVNEILLEVLPSMGEVGEDFSRHPSPLVRLGGYVMNPDAGGAMLISHAFCEPEPLALSTVEGLKKLARLATSDPGIVESMMLKWRSYCRTLKSSGRTAGEMVEETVKMLLDDAESS